MLRRIRTKLNIFTIVSVIAGLLIIIPLLNIFVELRQPASDVWIHIRTYLLARYLRNTFILIFYVALLSSVLGFFAAYIITRFDFKGRKALSWMLILPLAIPSYIMGYVYGDMMSYSGSVSRFFRSIGYYGYINVMTMQGAIIIFSLTLYPYVYMMVRGALLKQSASFSEGAQLLGASKWRVFWRIVLPLARPALVAGTLLVILETLNDYGLVEYFNVQVFSFAIFNAWFSFGDVLSAIRLSAILMLIVFAIVFLERAIRGRRRYHLHTKTRPVKRVPLKGMQKLYPIILWTILFIAFFIPVLQLLWFTRFARYGLFNLNIVYIIINSISIAVFATLITVIIALMLANFNRGRMSSIKKSWLKITNLGYAIPGAVLAIAVNIFFIDLDRLLYPVYQLFNPETGRLVISLTLTMLIFAYVLRFMAIGYNSIEASYDKIGESFTEAAYALKSSKIKTLMKIDFPLIKTGLLSAAIIVFIDVIKELPLTLILRPTNYNTMATIVHEYASDEMLVEASIPALVLILVSSIMIYILTHAKSKRGASNVR